MIIVVRLGIGGFVGSGKIVLLECIVFFLIN